MKTLLPFLTIALIFSSCTTVYKSGQTPDDVYYSPARPQDEYVRVEKDRDERRYDGEAYDEDAYLRMKVRNRSRWSTVDYDDYYTYRYNPACRCECWSAYKNPYYYGHSRVYAYYPKSVVYNKPRTFSLDYRPQQGNGTYNPKTGTRVNTQPSSNTSNDNYRNSGSNAGSYLRDVFGKSSSSSSSSPSSSSTSSGSSSGNNSSSSGSSGTAPVRRF